MWYNHITFGGRPSGSERISSKYRALFTHPHLPGLLLKEVLSYNDLKANCQGFMVFKGSRLIGGVVGASAEKYMVVGDPLVKSIALPQIVRGATQASSNPYNRGSTWASLTPADPTRSSEGLHIDSAVLTPGVDKPSLATLQGYLSGAVAPSGGIGAIGYGVAGHITGTSGASTISSFITDVTGYSVFGIVTSAEDGRFCYPNKFDHLDDAANRIYNDSFDAAATLTVPMNFGWLSSEFTIGTLGAALLNIKAQVVAEAPSDVRPFLSKAFDQFAKSAPGLSLLSLKFMSTFDMLGYVGLWRVAHGIPMMTMGATGCKATNIPAARMIDVVRPQAMDASSVFFDAVRVHQLGSNGQTDVFTSMAASHCLAVGIDPASDKILPWPTGGGNFESAMTTHGMRWEAIRPLLEAQVATVPTGNVAPQQTTTQTLSSVNALGSQHINHWSKCLTGSPALLQLQRGITEVYKLAEELAKDS